MRDYVKWHDAYDDPASDMSWRLRQVQAYIRSTLDQIQGQLTVLSLCAGDGRDVLQVLVQRDDSARIHATLIELHPVLAQRAREFAAQSGLANVTVRAIDAGNTTAYAGSVPAHLVIMMGIFGNISDDDIRRTIQTAPQLCQPGAVICCGPEARTVLTITARSAAGWPRRASPSWITGNSITPKVSAQRSAQPGTRARCSR